MLSPLAFSLAPSGTPQGVTRVNTTSTEITLQWREVPCIDRNGDIVGYTVCYSISGSNNTILRSASDKLAVTLVDLIPFANYSIEVAAVNVNGTGPFSTPVYMRTDDDSKWMYRHTYSLNLQFSLLVCLLKVFHSSCYTSQPHQPPFSTCT